MRTKRIITHTTQVNLPSKLHARVQACAWRDGRDIRPGRQGGQLCTSLYVSKRTLIILSPCVVPGKLLLVKSRGYLSCAAACHTELPSRYTTLLLLVLWRVGLHSLRLGLRLGIRHIGVRARHCVVATCTKVERARNV